MEWFSLQADSPAEKPDVYCIQEVRLADSKAVEEAEAWSNRAGYHAVISKGRVTGAALTEVSVGTAILCKRHLLGFQPAKVTLRHNFGDRISIAQVFAGPLCITILSVYLKDGCGLSGINFEILKVLAAIIFDLEGLWVMMGDFNLLPRLLIESGWPHLVRGKLWRRPIRLVTPQKPSLISLSSRRPSEIKSGNRRLLEERPFGRTLRVSLS